MHIEIELQSPGAKEDIYELRNYLQENLESISLHIKELPAQPGQMSLGEVAGSILGQLMDPVVGGVVEAIVGMTLHQVYDRTLKSKINAWLKSKKEKGKTDMSVLSTLKNDNAKVHFLQNSDGDVKVYDNVNYAIDTDRTHAVLVGSGEFDGSFSAIPPVQGNLEDFYHVLTDKLNVGLPKENVTIAYNKSNTEIEETLLRTSRLPNMDTLIIYYAGHGHRTDVKKLYLIARNTKKIDDFILGGIDFDFVNNAVLKSSSAKQKILIIDACHSGIATQGNDSMMADIDVKGTYILTSSPGDEVSYFDKNSRNTYFTGVLLDVLKKGIDNSNEMLALDDLYEHAHSHLQQKNFPHPISKSQLNIPASQFFIAHNPSFSPEKQKRKPSQLYSQGRLQDALYEYEVLLQKYPDDLQLRREAEQCRSQSLFTQLVHDADELFYQYSNYKAALEKYRKALQVKQDDMVLSKISKCEERIRSGVQPEQSSQTNSNDGRQKDIPAIQQEKNEPKQVPTVQLPPIRTVVTPPQKEKKEQLASSSEREPKSYGFTLLAVIWLGLVIGLHLLSSGERWTWYLPSAPMQIVTIALFYYRGKKLSNTEFLLYAAALILCVLGMVIGMSRGPALQMLSALLAGTAAVWYYLGIKKRLTVFNLLQLIIAGMGLIFLCFMTGSVLIHSLVNAILETEYTDDYDIAGSVLGIVTGIGLMIYLMTNRKR